ncbi:MAG: Crp/Fnr family transcriptional regulator [Thermotogota bacterium]|nr:Crp/Fnr family transcriptional regulator [Thermotogota bacterium]
MLLKQLLEKAPERIKQAFEHKHYTKGTLIISPDEQVKHLYILTDGEGEIYQQNLSGVLLLYTIMTPYSCFGEVEIINNKLKPLSVIAKTDCQILRLQRNLVFEWMKLDFHFNLYLFEQLAEKLRNNSEKLFQLAAMTVKDRILYSLYTHYKIGDLDQLTKKQISYEVATPIRSVNRALSILSEEGLITHKKKHFSIHFPEKVGKYLETIME